MNVTSALNAIRCRLKMTSMDSCSLVAVPRKESKWSIFGRYLAGMLIGSLATSMYLLQPSPAPVSNDQELYRLIGHYRNQTVRDDKLLNVLLDGSWRRDCGYRVVPWTQLADGSIRQSIIQVCDEVEK
jgi:hypothetical protein